MCCHGIPINEHNNRLRLLIELAKVCRVRALGRSDGGQERADGGAHRGRGAGQVRRSGELKGYDFGDHNDDETGYAGMGIGRKDADG